MNNQKLALILLIILFTCVACSPLPSTVLARQYEEKQEYQKAIEVYEKLLTMPQVKTTDNKDTTYLYYLLIGDNYLKLDNPSSAEEYYAKAISADTPNEFIVDRIRLLSRYYVKQNDYEQAINILNKYHDVSPEDIDYSIDKLHKRYVEQLKTNE